MSISGLKPGYDGTLLGDTLCVVEHLSSILVIKRGKSVCCCVTAAFVGGFYRLLL